jgi:hypothetical protein
MNFKIQNEVKMKQISNCKPFNVFSFYIYYELKNQNGLKFEIDGAL